MRRPERRAWSTNGVAEVRKRIKGEHPANMVTLRGWSKEPGLPGLADVFKLKAAALAVYPMYKGLASLVGMHLVQGLANLDDQIEALKSEWNNFDFFFVHYKYTDSRGEDGDFDAKVAEIEKVDKEIPRILSLKPDVLVVTGDHSTPAVLKSHSWHPVPVLMWAPGVSRTNPRVTGFGESECILGALGRFNATDLMPLITAHALRQTKFGGVKGCTQPAASTLPKEMTGRMPVPLKRVPPGAYAISAGIGR